MPTKKKRGRKWRLVVAKDIRKHRSTISGLGIFTHEDIKKGEYIFRTAQRIRQPSGYSLLLHFNHSCEPNTWMKEGQSDVSDEVYALRDIGVGEELTFDYRDSRWKDFFYDLIEGPRGGCRCPSCAPQK